MNWIIVNDDGNESEPFDKRAAAEDEKQSLEQLGATVELREVDDESEDEDVEPVDGGTDDVDAEVIEMSGDGGNTDTDDDDSDDSVEIVGDGSGQSRVYCRACGRFSTKIYRCSGCGHDLAGEGVDEWGDDE